jgi:hypothetical protein
VCGTLIWTAIAAAVWMPVRCQAQGVQILAIDAINPPTRLAASPLLVSYNGGLPGVDQIYVRVFRGSKDYLMHAVPRMTAAKDCALYTGTQLYPVSREGGVLRMDGLAEFFALQTGAYEQTFTLVFESGYGNVSDGELMLSKTDKGVSTYFAHAIEWTLNAPSDVVDAWNAKAKADQHQQPAENKPASWWNPFAAKPVSAAAGPSNAGAAKPAAPAPVQRRADDCQIVAVYPKRPGGQSANDVDAPLLAYAEREPAAGCKADSTGGNAAADAIVPGD